MVPSNDMPYSGELMDGDSTDETLINYDGILVVDKTPSKRTTHQHHVVPKELDPKDESLIVEEECMSEEDVEHLLESVEEHTESDEAMNEQSKRLVDDISAGELDQLDEELEAIMNTEFDSFKEAGTAAELISAEKTLRGDDLSNWSSYTNKHETVLDLTRPQDDQKEFVSKTYMIGTTRVVAASEAVKESLWSHCFPTNPPSQMQT